MTLEQFPLMKKKGTCIITGFAESVESIPKHGNLGMSYPHDEGTKIRGFKILINIIPCNEIEDGDLVDPGKHIVV